MIKYFILTFPSTHQVLMAEKLLLVKGIRHEIIPTPKNISSDCGMSIRLLAAGGNIEMVKTVLTGQNFLFSITEVEK